ncbi:tetratricopeptide repeat protein [Muriicola sp.]|uniref:tetratricopeptide repeat protein n=1 Tax=Muriicola sp. TaxID=2020856 RepID=UPI003C72DD69
MSFKEFIKECHEKEVFKNLSIYIVSSWVLIQVFSTIWEPFGLPKISMTYLLLVLIAGFPFYIYLIWRYRLKPMESKFSQREGLKVSSGTNKTEPGSKKPKKRKIHLPGVHFYSPFQKLYFTMLFGITVMSVFATALIVNANFLGKSNSSDFVFAAEDQNNKIAVLEFDNNTANQKLDVVSKMAADWIIHGITQNNVGQVISPKIIEEYATVLNASMVPSKENSILTEYLKPGKIINGTYYLNDGKLILQCSILDGNMNKTLISFEPVECDPNSPLTCIEELKQRILGHLSKGKPGTSYEESPPKFEAFKTVIEAFEKYDNSAPEFLNAMNDAIEIDSSYFEPKLHRITYYYNKDEYAMADSLVGVWARESNTGDRQLNLIRMWESLLNGDNRKAFNYFRKEYNYEPDDINNNMSTMVLALQFVNRPEAVDSIYNQQLHMERVDLNNCQECEYRYYVKGLADIALGNPQKPIEMFGKYGSMKGFDWVKDVLINAYVVTGNYEAVAEIINSYKLTADLNSWRKKTQITAKEFLRVGSEENAHKYFNEILSSFEAQEGNLLVADKQYIGYAHFYKGDYAKAEEIFRSLLNEVPESTEYKTYLAMSIFKIGKEQEANSLIAALDKMRQNYQYGLVDYAKARYYAFIGDEDLMMQNLIRAVSAGKRYTPDAYQHDILMKPYVQTEAFQRVLNFWH